MFADERAQVLEDARVRDGTAVSRLLPAVGYPEILVINDLVAIAVHSIRKYVAVNDICDIPVFFNGGEIGSICLLSQIRQDESTVPSLTNYQYAAYLALAPLNAVSSGSWAPCGYDALVLNRADFWCYWKNRNSSTLWGGFVALNESNISDLGRIKSDTANIVMYASCKARTTRHSECLELATLSNDLTDRFLHLYHYLELDYDYEVVRQIKLLDENDPRGLWDALKLQQADTDRLYHILKDYSNISFLENIIQKMRTHSDSAIRIFYDYGKDSNPLKSEDAFRSQFLNAPTVSRVELDTIKKRESLGDDFASKTPSYEQKLKKLACYWIYRFRCSIAHNKLGEYYLNRVDDIEFLTEFGEPLLCEMVRYRMSKK